MKMLRAIALWLMCFLMTAMSVIPAFAEDYQLGYSTKPNDNHYLFSTKAPKGTIGKSMTISFRVKAPDGEEMKNVKVGLSSDTSDFQQSYEQGSGDYTIDKYPFEITETTFVPKSVGNIGKGGMKSVSLSARVRRDAQQGYYSIPIVVTSDSDSVVDYINVWISTSSTTSDQDAEEDKKEGNYFVVGENQSTPKGTYPEVMNFTVNFRNKRETTAQDVTIKMGLSEDDTKFPFEINDGNYDRTYERIAFGESVAVPYSMAIRKDSYTGYYPIKFTITFRLSSEGDLHTEENTFYVYVTSKNKEDDMGDFNANDRTRARLIVDSYYTIPEQVYAGDEFELVMNMKNASKNVGASNILFTLESEKASDSAVFTTEAGASSLVVDDMAPGQTRELRARFTARAGVDQRSYAITLKEKYDSPEFKNAEESINLDIPVKQYARLSTSNIDVMPNSLTVGAESNVMFGINNTGKVILYNVTATFSADSIKPVDSYVGNIKPGETGNVDAMLTAIAPTTDDGTVKVSITYEDENGNLADPVEKEITLTVTEDTDVDDMGDMNWDDMDVSGDATAQTGNKKNVVVIGAACVIAVCAVLIIILKIVRKRKAQKEEEDI